MRSWVLDTLTELVPRKKAEEVSQNFYDAFVDGDILDEIDEENCRELGMPQVGLRKKFMKRRNRTIKQFKNNEVTF